MSMNAWAYTCQLVRHARTSYPASLQVHVLRTSAVSSLCINCPESVSRTAWRSNDSFCVVPDIILKRVVVDGGDQGVRLYVGQVIAVGLFLGTSIVLIASKVPSKDPTSQSNYTQIVTINLCLDWNIDFDKKHIRGSATYHLLAKADVSEVIFDTRVLDIESVEVNGYIVKPRLDPEHPVMGSALHIPLPFTREGGKVLVKIAYKTTEESPALLWLSKELTEGKKFPYLFSQCYPIHARSLVPLQDTPSVKLTYDAKVTSVFPVLLSAQRVSPPSDGPPHGGKAIGQDVVTYEYKQHTAIPSYLLAIAAGNLRYRAFAVPEERPWLSGVWTEPELLDDAFDEFCDDTPQYLAAAEDLIGPYKFGVYDLLVLPHSFPYGGMENPCLSFVTPTIITGDRSSTNVITHELSHSWFGNGVTHAHASHFWLNEGWTTYIERLLLGLACTPGHRGLSYAIGYKNLLDALERFEPSPNYQRLVIGFEVGDDPDEAYSSIPYEKGANLLLLLERTLGGIDAMLPYVRDYVGTFVGHSITTLQWKEHLYLFFRNQDDKVKALDTIDWDTWFYGEGVTLPVKLEYDMTLVTVAYDLADRWNASRNVDDTTGLDFKTSDLDELGTKQRVVFLECLETCLALPPSHLYHLDTLYKLSETTNSKIRTLFYLIALKDPASSIARQFAQPVLDWVIGKDTGIIQGLMKTSRQLFSAVDKVDREKTLAAYYSSRALFHPITRKLIEQDLGLSD